MNGAPRGVGRLHGLAPCRNARPRRVLLCLATILICLGALNGCAGIVSSTDPSSSKTHVSFQLSPLSLSFGNVVVGKQTSQNITLTNTGNVALSVNQAALSNPQFSLSGVTLPASVAAAQSITFSVSVNPTAAGSVSGTLTVQGKGNSNPVVVSLSANAVSPQPQISLSNSIVEFGTVAVGSQGSSNLTVSNTGSSDLTVSVITLSGSEFGVSGIATPKTIPAGQIATLALTFRPTSIGAAAGTLAITSNDPTNQTLNVPLTGSGVAAPTGQLSASPAGLSFGSVTSGGNSSRPVTLTNTGTAAVHISSVVVSGAEFSAGGLLTPATISPSQTVTLTVTFAPTATTSVTGNVTITSDATDSPFSIALSGTGTAAATGLLTASTSTVSFGNILAGGSSTQEVTLTNTGSAAVHVSSIAATGTGFSVSGVTTPATINPSNALTLIVGFAPTTTGNATARTVISDATGSPLIIALSGTGTQAGLSVSPTTFNFGSVVDGQTKSQNFSITNTGTANLTVSQISISGTGYSIPGLATPTTIPAGQSAAFTVEFAPTTNGTLAGSVSISSNAPSSPTTVSLSGAGVAATEVM